MRKQKLLAIALFLAATGLALTAYVAPPLCWFPPYPPCEDGAASR